MLDTTQVARAYASRLRLGVALELAGKPLTTLSRGRACRHTPQGEASGRIVINHQAAVTFDKTISPSDKTQALYM
jgi:hypothetical protein